ncbi:MAG: Fe-Mn family superoxide dismutase [Reyranellales bacterium]|jgi:Fe-Mn family superoxide dismutase
MAHQIAPIAVRASLLSGLSEQMVVGHYENHYGKAVRALNDVGRELAALHGAATPNRLGRLKQEELSLLGSVALHELYFANLGGYRRAGPNSGLGRPDWHEVPEDFTQEIAADFSGADAWRREFTAMAQSLASGSGWVMLTYSRRHRQFSNQISTDHTQAAVDAAPVLVLDMYEHAYQMDFGANASAYIDTFFRNINWEVVLKRIKAAREHRPPPNEDPSWTTNVPSLSVEELAAQIADGSGVQVIDARQRNHMSLHPDLMAGAIWRDPDRIEEWIGELAPDKPVAVYCAWGFDVGRNVTKTLMERGFDARFLRGGVSAWYAAGGSRALKPSTR